MQRIFSRYRTVRASAIAALLGAMPMVGFAADTSLFPAAQQKPPLSPVVKSTLPPIDAPPEATPASPSSGPLRVVIPNIKPTANTAPQQTRVKRHAAAINAVPSELPPIETAQPASDFMPLPTATASSTSDFTPNGIIIDTAGLLPSVNYTKVAMFLSVPLEWMVTQATPTNAFAELAPAAGETAPPAPAATPQPNGVIIGAPTGIAPVAPAINAAASPPPAATNVAPPTNSPPAAVAPIVPDKPMAQATAANASEPEPTLSAKSKAILERLPPLDDKTATPSDGKDVAIARESAKPNLGENTQIAAHESKGIKVDVKRPSVDVSYELEKAYNALIAGKSDIAIRIYEDVLTNDPRNKDALFGLASTYHRLGQLDMARSLYGKLLSLEPRHRDGLNNFLVLLAEEAPEEALRQMDRLEAENPGFSPIPAQMAIIHKKLGQTDRAIEKMYRALALSPENITYRYNLAVMLDKAGKSDKAANLYAQVLDAHDKGEVIPGDVQKIQQRLTFIRSNTRR